jgi:hypothetical protein
MLASLMKRIRELPNVPDGTVKVSFSSREAGHILAEYAAIQLNVSNVSVTTVHHPDGDVDILFPPGTKANV